jgi:single-stranded DNA-binding protein
MLSALLSGTLASDPKSGTSKSGTSWSNCIVRVPCGQNKEGEAETAFVQVACFGSHAEALARLGKGDSISAQGQLKPTVYQKDGQARHGLSLTANQLLTEYAIRKKRGDNQAQAGGKANPTRVSHSGREQNQAYGEFVRRATAPAGDDFGDSEIPF